MAPTGPGDCDQTTLFVKIVFFTAGGPFGLRALESLATDHEILAVVRPADHAPSWKRLARIPARWMRLRHPDVVGDSIRRTAIPSIDTGRGEEGALMRELERVAPDLVCIATFPWLLAPEILAIPRNSEVLGNLG